MKILLNNRSHYFLIDEKIYKLLKEIVAENNLINKKGRLRVKLDFACFFIHLIEYRKIVSKDKIRKGYIPLKAQYLKEYHFNYKVYMDFLIENKIIQTTGYNADKGQCKGYRINKDFYSMKFVMHNWSDILLMKNFNALQIKAIEDVQKSTGHLTKWLDPQYLQIDYHEAREYVNESKELDESQKSSRMLAIEMIHRKLIQYQRKGKDNRLHSILTNLPKDLRRFLNFQGNRLQSVDIKCSQPYLLTGILNLLSNKDEHKLNILIDGLKKKVLKRRVRNSLPIMMQKCSESHNILEIQAIKKIIEDSDIYNHLAENFSATLINKIKSPNHYSDLFYDKVSNKKIRESFKI